MAIKSWISQMSQMVVITSHSTYSNFFDQLYDEGGGRVNNFVLMSVNKGTLNWAINSVSNNGM